MPPPQRKQEGPSALGKAPAMHRGGGRDVRLELLDAADELVQLGEGRREGEPVPVHLGVVCGQGPGW